MRIADGAHNSLFYIGLPVNIIDDVSLNRIVEQTIDRKIPPEYIFFRSCEDNAGGPASIDICLIRPESSDFKRNTLMNNQDHAELGSDRFGPRKDFDHLLGKSTGGDVIVGGFEIHHHIAHTSADEVCFVSVLSEGLDDLGRVFGFHFISVGPTAPLLAQRFGSP